MGLKDVVERIAGKRPTGRKQGSRGPREHKRERDESTIQVPVGEMPPASQTAPPPAAPPRPPAQQAPPHSAQQAPPHSAQQAPPAPPQQAPPHFAEQAPPVPAQQAPPAQGYAPPPVATAPTPSAPQPAPGRASQADATLYAEVPQIHTGELVGVLVCVDGELKGKVFKVFEGETRVGRGQDCDIQLLDAQVSREHALIVCEDGALAILPLQDKNPIFVGDEVVEEGAELSDGNLVRFGNLGASAFRFRTIEGL